MNRQNKKPKKQKISWSELIFKGLIDLAVSVVAAWLIKHLP